MSNKIGSHEAMRRHSKQHYPDENLPPLVEEGVVEGESPDPEPMKIIKGYEIVTGETSVKFPPPKQQEAKEPKEEPDATPFPKMSEEDARKALLGYVSSKMCWGKGTARNMKIVSISSSTSYQYILETFVEIREFSWSHEPYYGQSINSEDKGTPPKPWEIETEMGEEFQNAMVHIEIPYTACTRPCHVCDSYGYLICSCCLGRGKLSCSSCHGKGFKSHVVTSKCEVCFGSGTHLCKKCKHEGKKICPSCKGHKKLKWFIQLTVRWVTKRDEHTVEESDLPSEFLSDVRGIAAKETQTRGWPVSHFPDNEINVAAKELIEKHNNSFPDDVILLQRQTIRAVPVTECVYNHKGTTLKFYIFGLDSNVYAPEYPEQQCCTVL